MKATKAGTQAGLDINKSYKKRKMEFKEKVEKDIKEKNLQLCKEQFSSEKECREKVPDYKGIKCELCRRGGKI